MQKTKSLLCTRPVSEAIIEHAASENIIVDVISFISTEPLLTPQIINLIQQKAVEKTNVVFTSMNAVEQVTSCLAERPDWKIYCIGNTTRDLVTDFFGESSIAAFANNAAELGTRIIKDKIDKIVFFCGDIRRDELPEELNAAEIDVEEVIVYRTNETPVIIEKDYAGILFFSPSAVRSFFKNNSVNLETRLFAIGATTANEIKQYKTQNIFIADRAGKEDLVRFAIENLNGSPKKINY